MPTVDEMFPSKYLKASDLGGKVVRLKIAFVEIGVKLGNDTVNVLHFAQTERVLVMNKTNFNRIVMALHPLIGDRAKNTDNWTGQAIDLYEELVEFQGSMRPAIRVRAPGLGAGQQAPPPAQPLKQTPPAVTGHLDAPPPAAETDYGELLDDAVPF